MEINPDSASHFTIRAWLSALLPAYAFPALMSFGAGYLRHDADLMRASYSTIAGPSVVAAGVCLGLLWQWERRPVFRIGKWARTALLSGVLTLVAWLLARGLGAGAETFNITLSAFIGAATTTWRQPITLPAL